MLREVKLLKVTLLVNGSAMIEIQMCYIQSLWVFFFLPAPPCTSHGSSKTQSAAT